MNEEIDYKKLYDDEKRKTEVLLKKLERYEQNGTAKLYYALNRKSNEMADILNANSLDDISIGDKDNKSFDRIFKILEKSETVATSVKTLGEAAGVTGDEDKDVKKKPFIERLADKRD